MICGLDNFGYNGLVYAVFINEHNPNTTIAGA